MANPQGPAADPASQLDATCHGFVDDVDTPAAAQPHRPCEAESYLRLQLGDDPLSLSVIEKCGREGETRRKKTEQRVKEVDALMTMMMRMKRRGRVWTAHSEPALR